MDSLTLWHKFSKLIIIQHCPFAYSCIKNHQDISDAVTLLAGQRTCDSQVPVLAGHHYVVALGKLLTPVCASVTKHYNLGTGQEGDPFG